MNRFKLEQQRQHKAIRAGLSEHQIKQVDREENVQSEIIDLTRQIHLSRFPNEYDFMLDSHVDHAQRKRGINPMSDEYAATVAHKRAEAGVSTLGDDGMPVSRDTWEACLREADAIVRGG